MKTGPPRYRGYSRFCFVQCPSTLLSFTCVAFVSYAQGIESSSPPFLLVIPEVCACDSEAPDTLVRELTSLSLFLHVIDFTPLIFRFNSSVLATSFGVSSPMTIPGCVGATGIRLPRESTGGERSDAARNAAGFRTMMAPGFRTMMAPR